MAEEFSSVAHEKQLLEKMAAAVNDNLELKGKLMIVLLVIVKISHEKKSKRSKLSSYFIEI